VELEYNRAQRYGHPLSLIALHIDYVRPDSTGYARSVASQVLQVAAKHCLTNIRGIDLLGRYNHDVLVILLPETDEEAANLVSQRIRRFITAGPLETNRGPIQPVVDINLVTNQEEKFPDVEAMLGRALEPLIADRCEKETGAKESETKGSTAKEAGVVSNANLK
jgi:diguanylate cyclase (GGDEF)-like protein